MNLIIKNIPRLVLSLLFIIALTFLTGLFSSQLIYAQSNFQSGWVVTQNGDTLRGQIDNEEWVRSPVTIAFRKDSTAKSRTYSPMDLKSFNVAGEWYISKTVTIDQAPLSASRPLESVPEKIENRVFLTVLVKGPISLYYYNSNRDHFYLGDSSGVFELVSHEYVMSSDRGYFAVTSQKDLYRRQLAQVAGCSAEKSSDVRYTKESLSRYVNSCNGVKGANTSVYIHKTEKPVFSSRVFVGLLRPNLQIKFGSNWINFSSTQNLAFGYTGVLTLPRWRGRRAVFAGLQYFSFKMLNSGTYSNESVDYSCNTGGSSVSCAVTKTDETIQDMIVDLKYLKLTTGYRYTIITGPWGPFIEAGATVAYLLHERSDGNYSNSVYTYEGSKSPLPADFTLVSTSSGRKEIIHPGKVVIGAMGGVGINYNGFELMLRDEFSSMTFTQAGSPINYMYLLAGYNFKFR